MVGLESLVLWVHVTSGFVALFAGIGAILTRKGGVTHRRSGRTFVYAMAVVAGTALVLFGIERSPSRQFLGLIAIFSFYFAFSGYRVLSWKRPSDGPTAVDWLAVALLGVASAGILATGVAIWQAGDPFAPVLLVFGAIGAVVGARDVLGFAGRLARGTWLGEHVFRMGAGYVATLTAFSSVNFSFLPLAVRWLWPTVVGIPAIAYGIRRYERRFGLASRSKDEPE